MKEYGVAILPENDIDWSKIDAAMIDTYLWSDSFKPEAGAKVVYVKSGGSDEGIYAHLWCVEENPRAIYTKHNEPVFKDSCLEFFFTMNEPMKLVTGYINIESNCNPTTLIAYGFDRYTRTPIVDMGIEPFSVSVKKSPQRWELDEFIPLTVLQRVFGIKEVTTDTEFRGNFYKCGGDHKILPYGSWAPIDSPTPDFHRPDCFGRLNLIIS